MLPDMEELTQDDDAATNLTRNTERPARAGRRLCVMRSGARLFAVHADAVEATSERLRPTPLPFAPPPVRGVVSQRGRILTVIDPLLLLPPEAPSTEAPSTADAADAPISSSPHASLPARASTPLIVALRGDEQLALSVELIEHDIELFDNDEAHPTADDSPGSQLFLLRTIRHHTGSIALLNTAHLFEAAMQGVERRRRRQ
jgi:chemotaxis signal transduction protein